MGFFARLERLWVYGGFLSALFLLALTPLLTAGWSRGLLAVWLILPLYMIHQYEEHDDNRFERFMREFVGKGRPVLSFTQIFWINIGGVWGLNALALWLAITQDLAWGLLGLYAAFLNSVVHMGQAIRMKKYNPGLLTAVLLLLPFSVWGGWVIHGETAVGFDQELIAIGVAVGLHAFILALAARNLRVGGRPHV